MMSETGKIAVFTGASRGIGKGIAVALGERACTVYVNELKPKDVAAIALYPGSVATEFIQDAVKHRAMDLSKSQTPLFVGRAAAALLQAPDLMSRSGTIQWVEDLAEEFDIVDEHGRRPPGYARRNETTR